MVSCTNGLLDKRHVRPIIPRRTGPVSTATPLARLPLALALDCACATISLPRLFVSRPERMRFGRQMLEYFDLMHALAKADSKIPWRRAKRADLKSSAAGKLLGRVNSVVPTTSQRAPSKEN